MIILMIAGVVGLILGFAQQAMTSRQTGRPRDYDEPPPPGR